MMNQTNIRKSPTPRIRIVLACLAFSLLCFGTLAYSSYERKAEKQVRLAQQAATRDANYMLVSTAAGHWNESPEEIRATVSATVRKLRAEKLDDNLRDILNASLQVEAKGQIEFKSWCAQYLKLRSQGKSKSEIAFKMQ